jgi:hypothetical protein
VYVEILEETKYFVALAVDDTKIVIGYENVGSNQ